MVPSPLSLSTLSGILSMLAVILGYEDFICNEECNSVKLGGLDMVAGANTMGNSSLMDERRKSSTTNFLHTAPCPPIWNFTLVCNYFSWSGISCDESTTILKRCLEPDTPNIPCNTTLNVIKHCIEENSPICESLYDLYNNYCFNTCQAYCDKGINFTEVVFREVKDNASSLVDNSSSLLDNMHSYISPGIPSTNNDTHIKVIRVKDSRTTEEVTCDVLCVILLIGGSFFLIGILGIIGCCTIKRYRLDDSSYRVHSHDKCVGPDDRGADNALLPVIGFKDRGVDIPRRYRNSNMLDTSFAQVHHYPTSSHMLLGHALRVEELEDTRF